jgi:hypothetical protein
MDKKILFVSLLVKGKRIKALFGRAPSGSTKAAPPPVALL